MMGQRNSTIAKGKGEQVPEGISAHDGSNRAYSTDNVYPYSALPAAGRTFEVVALHHPLEHKPGVRFNVETVTPASKQDSHKPVLSQAELRKRRLDETALFYESSENAHRGYQPKYTPMRLEASSHTPERLVHAGGDGFMAACLTAFARHLPLALGPDQIWSMISYGFAKHVDKHAEELRDRFVQHEGKKRLVVHVDHFVMSGGVQGAGTGADLWERDVFPDFSRQIQTHIGDKVHGVLASEFSTTDATSKAAHEIVLMSAMKNYFSFGMSTCCGIPSISLLGELSDWVSLRERAEALGSLMTAGFAKSWLTHLLPVLDQFVAAYKGEVDHGFWQSIVKLRNTGGGSGSHSFISGWIQILYPYLSSGRENRSMRPWQDMYFAGPELDEFPSISSSAGVDWKYYGVKHDLHFHAGFAGVTQDTETGELTPVLGWHVTHDPSQDSGARLLELRKEIDELCAGHDEEQKEGDWWNRVCVLRHEESQLVAASDATSLQEKIKKLQQTQWSCGKTEQETKEIKAEIKTLEEGLKNAVNMLESA